MDHRLSPFQIWNVFCAQRLLRLHAEEVPRLRRLLPLARLGRVSVGDGVPRQRRPAARAPGPDQRLLQVKTSKHVARQPLKHPTLDLSRRTPDRGQPSSVTVCAAHRTGQASTSRWVHVRIMSRGVAQQSTSPAVELASLRHGTQVGSSSEPRCVHTCRVPPKTCSERVEDGGSKAGAEADDSNV